MNGLYLHQDFNVLHVILSLRMKIYHQLVEKLARFCPNLADFLRASVITVCKAISDIDAIQRLN
jgi:hypothetical protein